MRRQTGGGGLTSEAASRFEHGTGPSRISFIPGKCFGADPAWPIVIFSSKEDAKFDEREQLIRLKAFRWAGCAWALVLAIMCYLPFFVVGGAGNMGVYYLPAVFWCCILTAQVVYSAVILFQCRQEQSDE